MTTTNGKTNGAAKVDESTVMAKLDKETGRTLRVLALLEDIGVGEYASKILSEHVKANPVTITRSKSAPETTPEKV